MVLAMMFIHVLRAAALSAAIVATPALAALAQAEPPIPPESLHTAPHTRPHTSPHTLPHTAPHVRPHHDPHTIPHGGVSVASAADTSFFERYVAEVDARRAARHDSGAVAATIGKFHAALAAGDRAGALALLHPDVIVLESGGSESRAEYESHHLESDIAFARAVKSVRKPGAVTVSGDVAWAWSTSTESGEFRGRPVNSTGAELMVLRRDGDGWRIVAIHWSSRTRR